MSEELLPWQRRLLDLMDRGPLRLIVTRRGTSLIVGPTRAEAEKLYRRARRRARRLK